MRNKHLWGFFVLMCSLQVTAQIPQIEVEAFASEIVTTVEKNLAVKPLKIKKVGLCDPLRYIDQFDLKKLVPEKKPFINFIKSLDLSLNNSLKGLQVNVPLKRNENLNDKAIESLASSKTVGAFIKSFTGSQMYELEEQDIQLLVDYYINHPIKKNISTVTKSKNFVKAKFSPCFATANTELTLSKWKKYPNVTWTLTTKINVVCDCEEMMVGDLNQGDITFNSEIKGLLSSKSIKHLKAKLFPPTSGKSTCCGLEEHVEDETEEKTGPTEEYTPPKQTLGISGGIGFGQDFNETNVCFGAEYLYNVTEIGNSYLFIGANLVLENTSFNDFNNTWIGVGPTVQLFTPINPSKDVHVTNGISTGVLFGTNDNNGVKDDLSGFDISLNTGLNVPINENLALSIIVPIITHTNLEFTAEEGGSSFKSEATEVFFFKNSPVKFGVRINID